MIERSRKEWFGYENHEDAENAVAANPRTFVNPSMQQPEMIGRLRLSSIDPRSTKGQSEFYKTEKL